ncbi:MAG: GIY-YIG nuclease family protein [Methanobrevibacter thaueri]|jgi:Uri superfamily endonuclease|uniref:GIY-YIG nuclease family protein n=1 Tax=Methanobrevibacter thaueri TaxID=190975 RepID=UPI0026EC7770|nr:GIY-YIG nuclease family protein [Methanobrevibacter thaueri]MBE6495830.1 GIY-YIG nuclease family protein [Methanobrevibacter thaueri]
MKGCYCLIIHVKRKSEIRIGSKLGPMEFKRGIYVYVGSAMNSLESRLKRHLSDDKKLHWHIDYLLKDDNSKILDIIYNIDKKVECDISEFLKTRAIGVKNFGCSDCDCESHLYYFKNRREAIEQVKNAYDSIAMDYKFFKK